MKQFDGVGAAFKPGSVGVFHGPFNRRKRHAFTGKEVHALLTNRAGFRAVDHHHVRGVVDVVDKGTSGIDGHRDIGSVVDQCGG